MKVWAIVATALLRFTRDRFNLFFVFVLPLAIVLLIGLQYGDVGDPQLGLVVPADDTLGDELRQRLAEIEDLEVVDLDTRAEVLDRVDDGELDAGLVVPEGFSSSIADGDPIELTYVSAGDGLGPQLQNLVGDALSRTLAVPTAVHAAVELGADEDAARAAALGNESMLELLEVRTVTAGDRLFPEGTTGYDVGATGQLVLFVFLTSLTGSAAIIQSRRLGVTTRMLSTPTPVRTILLGEAVARFTIAVTQGVYIMLATVVLFGVEWGNLLASAAILAALGAVGAAAAMLSGATFANEDQASGITVVLALALGALGGSMLPIELFSDTMRTIAKAIPHFWAIDAFSDVVRHGATVPDILSQLGVLLAFAVAIGMVAVWRLRRTLVRP